MATVERKRPLFNQIADFRNPGSLAYRLRRNRFEYFKRLLGRVPRPLEILDVGGSEHFWTQFDFNVDPEISVTLLNLEAPETKLPSCKGVKGDARMMAQFHNDAFDVVFSNSVIEHVGDFSAQRQMANEVARVGKRYWVQTPNRYFPLEPHFLVPGFQFLPLPLRIRLVQNFNLGWCRRSPDYDEAKAMVDGIRLLTQNELTALFPAAEIKRERIFGLIKSFIVLGGWAE